MKKPVPKILVFGGRHYHDRDMVYKCLGMLEFYYPKLVVIQGGAPGADKLGKDWGKLNGHAGVQIDALWDYYQKGAGFIRNAWMQDIMEPDLGVEFPGGSGTADMRKRLVKHGVPVWEATIVPLDVILEILRSKFEPAQSNPWKNESEE
jgi:hypothetical protein